MTILSAVFIFAAVQQGPVLSHDAKGQVAGLLVPNARIVSASGWKGKTYLFEATESTGRPIHLRFFAKKPVVLVFLDRDCPYTRTAKSYFDQIQFAFRTDIVVLGVIDANQEDAGEWVEAAVPRFRIALDPELKIAKAYGATNGMHTVLISSDQKVLKSWPGFSGRMFGELASMLSNQPGVHMKPKLSFKSAPKELTSGNPLTPQEKK